MKRTHKQYTNNELLKSWLKNKKFESNHADADLLISVRISYSSWKKILYIKGYLPNAQTRLLLAQYTGLSEDELFPIAESDLSAA